MKRSHFILAVLFACFRRFINWLCNYTPVDSGFTRFEKENGVVIGRLLYGIEESDSS